MDLTLWEAYVRQVCEEHGFGSKKVYPGVPGTFPTFIVELIPRDDHQPLRSVVVKFFGPLFDGEGSFRIERDMGLWLKKEPLPIPSPVILAEGRLDNHWQYLIFEHINGVSIGQVRDTLSKEDWASVACQMGEYIHQLHTRTAGLALEMPRSMLPCMDTYTSFLQRQRLNCLTNHKDWKDLPAHLLDQLEGFVLPVESLLDFSAPAYLIHADLTSDHLLGRLVNGRWQILAIIDWGDAMTGNLLYELVALHLDLFHTDKLLLRVCLDAYGLPSFYRHDFPRKALSLVLLHQFPMPAWVYAPYLDVQSLQELAERLFAV
jgi:Ser/Thr protein kinase RdoA (MazF antagonist)